MRVQSIQFPDSGDQIAADQILIKNKTGGTMAAYGVYALDLTQADADTDTIGKALYHAVATSADNLHGVLVVVGPKAIPDDEIGQAYVSGRVTARVNGAVALTDTLKAVAGQNYLQAADAGSTSIGAPLETNEVATTNPRAILFDGFAWRGRQVPQA